VLFPAGSPVSEPHHRHDAPGEPVAHPPEVQALESTVEAARFDRCFQFLTSGERIIPWRGQGPP